MNVWVFLFIFLYFYLIYKVECPDPMSQLVQSVANKLWD